MALAALYLVHARVPPRARAFVLGGGLRALLAALADSESLQLRGQALETLRLLTREEVFPWHGEDPGAEAPSAGGDLRGEQGGTEARALRQRMLELAGRGLVGTLLKLYDSPFPGASALALQVLAFFLSFVRRNFCQDGQLQLSQGLLDALGKWAARLDAAEGEAELAGVGPDANLLSFFRQQVDVQVNLPLTELTSLHLGAHCGALLPLLGRGWGRGRQQSPISERFFMGGIGSLRGFRFKGVGPSDVRKVRHPAKVGRSACPGAARIVMSFPLKKRQVTGAPS